MSQFADAIGSAVESNVAELLELAGKASDVADVEFTVLEFATSLPGEPMLDRLGPAIADSLEEQRSPNAATVLSALAALAPEAVSRPAQESVERLAAAGTKPDRESVGSLRFLEAWRHHSEKEDLVATVLERPGDAQVQLVLLVLENEKTAGALFDAILTPRMPVAKSRDVIASVGEGLGSESSLQLTEEEVLSAVRSGLERLAEQPLGATEDMVVALPLLSRALLDDPQALPLPPPEPPEMGHLRPEDEEAFELEREATVGQFITTLGTIEPIERSGDYVVSSLLDWKFSNSDGRLGHWTGDDLEEYLLDYFPRKLSSEPELIDDAIRCLSAFFVFLDERRRLEGEPLDELLATLAALERDFTQAATDRENWGPAKALVAAMRADGVEPTDEAAMQAWIHDYNSGPRERRDAILGWDDVPPGSSTASSPPSRGSKPEGPRPAERRSKRKTARQARKRNRR